jgi:hypothetical protein
VPTTLTRWITGELITGRQKPSRFRRRINTELASHASPAAPKSTQRQNLTHIPHEPESDETEKKLDPGAVAESRTVNWQSDEATQGRIS